MHKVFVDGAAGTVGMALRPHLSTLATDGTIQEVTLPEALRKDTAARSAAMANADIVVLCLPSSETREAVQLALRANPKCRILDASVVHRCEPDWVYGLPEVVSEAAIQQARFVANPGCFATACILGARPLKKLLRAHHERLPVLFHGVTGLSAASKASRSNTAALPCLTQFGSPHKHLPEIARFADVAPALTTLVGDWYQGMLVQFAVPASETEVLAAYREAYSGMPDIRIVNSAEVGHKVSPLTCNGTNAVQLVVAEQPHGGVVVAVVLDNLGKGSAGAAAMNLRLMCGGSVSGLFV